MRIAVFIKGTTFHQGYGGLETQNKILCEGLASRGYEVVVFTPQKDLKERELIENGVKYLFVPCIYRMGLFSSKDPQNWVNRSVEEFKLFHEQKKFELIVSQSSAGIGVIKKKQLFKLKVVSISHGTIISEFKSAPRNFKNPKEIVKMGLDAIYVYRNFFGRQRQFIYGSDKVVAVSSYVQQALIEETFVPEELVTVIHNGMDEKVFEKFSRSTFSEKINLIYVGRILQEKGVFNLIEAFSKINNQNIHLNIVGSGRDFESLKQMITQKGLQEKVTLFGTLDHTSAISKLFDSHIFVLPTIRIEGFPMTLVEALFAELPIIASDIGGIRDAVKNGENGYLLQPGDIMGLHEKIIELYNESQLRQKMGSNGKIYASKNFSLNAMLDKYENVFNEVLNNS